MNRRPVCLVCLIWIGCILVCRAAGLPLFGKPELTAEEEALLADGCTAVVTGKIADRDPGDEYVRYTLDKAVVILRGRKIPFRHLFLYADTDGQSESYYSVGTIVYASGELTPIAEAGNPGQFDAAAYYACTGCYYRMWAEKTEVILQGGGFRESLLSLRERTIKRITQVMHEEPAGILIAMLLGDKAFLTDDTKIRFQTGGVLHLLVISGLHVMLLGTALREILLRLRLPCAAADLCAGGMIIFYTVFVGSPVAAVRACIMFLLCLLARVFRRTYDPLSAMAFAALFMLIREPGLLFHAGFRLSYAAAFGASVVSPVLCRLMKEISAGFSDSKNAGSDRSGYKKPENGPAGETENTGFVPAGFISRLRNMLSRQKEASVSWLAIQLCTLPLVAGYYCEIPVWSLPVNLLLVPWVQYILIIGVAGGLACIFFPAAAGILLFPADLGLSLFNVVLEWFLKLPGGTWICGEPSAVQMAGFYLLFAAAMILLVRKKKRISKQKNKEMVSRRAKEKGLRRPKERLHRKGAAFIFLLLGAACFFLFFRLPEGVSLTMLDVGQGDCLVIRQGGTVFLFDGGSTNVRNPGANRILPYCKSQGIRRIEGIFVSHDDDDHMNGIEEILRLSAENKTSLQVGYLFLPDWMCGTEGGKRLISECAAAKVKVRTLVRGDSFKVKDMQFSVLHPFSEDGTEENAYLIREGTGEGLFAVQPETEGLQSPVRAGTGEGLSAVQPETEGLQSPVRAGSGVRSSPAREGNAGSLVLEMKAYGWKTLLTGDLEKEGEEELIPYLGHADCLKVGHHGSRNSTSEELLRQTEPHAALISAPKKSTYGHPHAETLERLEEYGAEIYITKDSGAIRMEIRREGVRIREYHPTERS
ncbi:MAG: ComEC/Rec2 family competence protein [Eubacterium sp.]|nr:ComEC/Rec2 family competence protein [Eubacterium sp.]